MLVDLKLFLEYLVIVYAAFTLAFFGMGRAGLHSFNDNVFTYDGASAITNWGMFGWIDPPRVESPSASAPRKPHDPVPPGAPPAA